MSFGPAIRPKRIPGDIDFRRGARTPTCRDRLRGPSLPLVRGGAEPATGQAPKGRAPPLGSRHAGSLDATRGALPLDRARILGGGNRCGVSRLAAPQPAALELLHRARYR